MAPSAVTLVTAAAVRLNLMRQYREPQQQQTPKYRVGDIVRISSSKAAFAKGYESGWTSELFKIHRVSYTRCPVVYFLRDLHNEDIDGIFYEPELSRVQITLTKVKSNKSEQKKKGAKR